jgi:diguanylate cyclase (GGDEF)-like protein
VRQRTAEVHRLANYDVVTDLPNRVLFEDRISQAVAQRRYDTLGVLFVSLDRFKKVTDTLGSTPGDQVLREVASRFNGCIDAGDTVARLEGAEFAFLLTQTNSTDSVIETIGCLNDCLQRSFSVEGQELFLSASIGISLYPLDGSDAQTLLRNASAALYRAKSLGGNNYQFYKTNMNARALRRLSLETNLRRALERDELTLHYQPQVAIDSLRVTGVECLVRWQSPQLGRVSPSEFVPLAEDTGLIEPLGDWVLRTACAQNKQWLDAGLGPLRVAVNLSARQFGQRNLTRRIVEVLTQTGLDPQYLNLELTESSIMRNRDLSVTMLGELRDMGVKLSLDDFGTGFSSLAYLKHLPIDTLKIDQSFVKEMTSDPDDAALVMSVINLAHNLRLKVVAEGVETREQFGFLSLLRCDEVQGYLISKPLSAQSVVGLIKSGVTLPFEPTGRTLARKGLVTPS